MKTKEQRYFEIRSYRTNRDGGRDDNSWTVESEHDSLPSAYFAGFQVIERLLKNDLLGEYTYHEIDIVEVEPRDVKVHKLSLNTIMQLAEKQTLRKIEND